ncbi:MAG: hypothetical protein HY578_03290 [Nitrospinae bacterium]|nr:hypothetical protein [Nitrospinota bacterium]
MADENIEKEEKGVEIPNLTEGLKRVIQEKIIEVELIEKRLSEKENELLEKLKKIEGDKKRAEIELKLRTSEFTLSSLHRVIRNPDIIRYLEEVGDILVYSKDRGFGNNMIFFSKNERKTVENELQKLNITKEEITNSSLVAVEKENNLKEINDRIAAVKAALESLIYEGGIISLYLQSKDIYFRLDLYSKDERVRDQSLSLMKVYFGVNEKMPDCFNEFNTPERIMEQIEKNISDDKYCARLNELKKKLNEIKI